MSVRTSIPIGNLTKEHNDGVDHNEITIIATLVGVGSDLRCGILLASIGSRDHTASGRRQAIVRHTRTVAQRLLHPSNSNSSLSIGGMMHMAVIFFSFIPMDGTMELPAALAFRTTATAARFSFFFEITLELAFESKVRELKYTQKLLCYEKTINIGSFNINTNGKYSLSFRAGRCNEFSNY
jgi:hypothetical protein